MPDQVKTRAKSEETRERIFRSALDIFHDRGFDSATMREIAARAEVATGAAYYYFASKDAIVLAFYEQARREMAPQIERALDESRDLRERLRKIIRVKLDYFAPSRKLLGALSAHTNPQFPLSPFSDETRQIREEDIHFFERALAESRTPGPKDLKNYLPRLLWMYQMGIILYWINDSSKGQEKTGILLEKSLDLVTRLIQLAGLPLTGSIRKKVVQLMDALIEG